MTTGLEFRHLAFTGPRKPTASLSFKPGTNVIYGASNTGKSFTLAALRFMLGSSGPLPVIEQSEGYDAATLGLVMPSLGEVTLYRSVNGGALRLYSGLHQAAPSDELPRILAPEHDANRTENLSRVILAALGLDNRKVVKNENGEKNSFTLRYLDPFVFVEEGAIIDPRSPILSGQSVTATAEKNAFKLLLTGHDDSAVVAVVPPKVRRARQEGQRELIESWIADLDKRISNFDLSREKLAEQLRRIEASLETLQTDLASRQGQIDWVTRERRRAIDNRDRVSAQAREVELTLGRFARLMEVYESDVERLEALEQGGHLLLSRLDRPCPLCGALAEHHHNGGRKDVERAKSAARAEIARIDRERLDLVATIKHLEVDSHNLSIQLSGLSRRIAAAERLLARLRPVESDLRVSYAARMEKRDELRDKLRMFEDRDRWAVRLSQVSASTPERGTKLTVGIDGPTGHQFARKVGEVLHAWHFPGEPTVSFDSQLQDIRLNGKERRANGKGVRAVLHAAFKIATLLYCQERGLPHPGIIVLDTPLLTYREPMRVSKYGELDADEKVLAATTLQEHFYQHLISLRGSAQFIILENSDPPVNLLPLLHTHVFTGDATDGRIGFFPPQTEATA